MAIVTNVYGNFSDRNKCELEAASVIPVYDAICYRVANVPMWQMLGQSHKPLSVADRLTAHCST